MSLESLNYEPNWHHVGDPDNIALAIAYGTLSLGAILLLEYISAGLLFSKANGILISDAAAAVTFNSATWLDLGRWAFVNRPSRRICKRAVLAIFLRYFILALDILILVVSLPRSIPVYERQVGSSVIAFSNGPLPRDRTEATAALINAPCKPDLIEYKGFKPSATRQLCFSSIFDGTSGLRDAFINAGLGNLNTEDLYIVLNHNQNRALQVVYINAEIIFTYSHIMRVEDGTRYLLPPRPGIVDEYVRRLMKEKRGTCKSVQNIPIQKGTTRGIGTYIRCPKDPSVYGAQLPRDMFSLMKTRPLPAGEARNKYTKLNTPVTADLFEVGVIDRPRVCILPAVIMFLSLLVVATIVRYTKGKQDLSFKQWAFVSRAYGSENTTNPLYSECSEFEKWNTADGSIASFHQSQYRQDIESSSK